MHPHIIGKFYVDLLGYSLRPNLTVRLPVVLWSNQGKHDEYELRFCHCRRLEIGLGAARKLI